MKAVYREDVFYYVHLKDGTILTDSKYDGWTFRRWTYGEVPKDYVKTYTDKECIFDDLLKEIGYVDDWDGLKTFFSKRRFIRRDFEKRVYEDEIDYFEVKYKYTIYKNPSTNWLQKNLGFTEYSELVFDREQELKAVLLEN